MAASPVHFHERLPRRGALNAAMECRISIPMCHDALSLDVLAAHVSTQSEVSKTPCSIEVEHACAKPNTTILGLLHRLSNTHLPKRSPIRPSNGLTSVSQSTCRCQVEAVWGRKAGRHSAAKCCLHEGIQAVEKQTGLKACSSQDLGRILQER